MDRYLEQKYKGIYRIKAHFDIGTNDWVRNQDGDLEESFDDFYIECKNNIEIKHGIGNILSCYIPSLKRGNNIIRQLYSDKVGKDCEKLSVAHICKTLVEKEILIDIDVLDSEVYFTFKSTLIEYMAELVGARTSGSSISPFSIKNLPKSHYNIPESDMEKYKNATKTLPTRVMERKDRNGKIIKIVMVDGLVIRSIMCDFEKIIKKYKGAKYDINTEQRKIGLKGRDFIHYSGFWDEFIDFLTHYNS